MDRLQQRCGKRGALKTLNGIKQGIQVRMRNTARREKSLPVREKACQRVLLHRLDFAAKPGQRFAADLAQNLRIAPLAMQAAGTETAFENAAFMRQKKKRIAHQLRIKRKPVRGFALCERAVGARIAAHQFEHRLRNGLQECSREARREGNPQCIAIAGRIFRGNQATLSANAQLKQSAGSQEPVNILHQVGRHHTPGQLFAREVAEAQAKIVNAVGSACTMRLDEALRGFLDLFNCVCIKQLAQVGFAKQLAQLVLIDGEGLRSTLGQRRVAVIEEIGHVAE